MVRPRQTPVVWECVRTLAWIVAGLALVLLLGGNRPLTGESNSLRAAAVP